MGALAFIYGRGDFERTVGIAIAAGFDCDNQAATLAGLVGVMHGASNIPRSFTHEIAGNNWSEAFNDRYVNERRAPLPRENTNTDIIGNISAVARAAILEHGGAEFTSEGELSYSVRVSTLLMGSLPTLPSPDPEPTCCSACEDKPFCSDVSGHCYWHKAKEYYRSCAQPSPDPEPTCCSACE